LSLSCLAWAIKNYANSISVIVFPLPSSPVINNLCPRKNDILEPFQWESLNNTRIALSLSCLAWAIKNYANSISVIVFLLPSSPVINNLCPRKNDILEPFQWESLNNTRIALSLSCLAWGIKNYAK
jgi:hypothetical protein